MIKSLISEYIDHYQEPSFFEKLFDQNSAAYVAQTLIELLHEQNDQIIENTLFFIRDLALTPQNEKHATPHRMIIFETPVITLVENLTMSKNYFTQSQSIYTLGKIGSVQSIQKLYDVFQKTKESNPLLVPRIITEIWWLEPEKNWNIIMKIVSAVNDVTRWSCLAVLFTYSGGEHMLQMAHQVLNTLRQDTNEHIRNEATYQWLELAYRQERLKLTKSERKLQRIHIKTREPLFTFSDIAAWFENKMVNEHRTNYTTAELAYFIETDAPVLAEKRRTYQRLNEKSS